eukprot:TRINITY_DN1555_c2_g1_i1.p1 TRINITY_DN1555_c2_g1~~TRINITY_DN1555_c2_g1_i1.p1  ORF type:complete len:661 (+),score=83.31 TRINITY_DN1555_c2_g1_i1:58-2040(+)
MSVIPYCEGRFMCLLGTNVRCVFNRKKYQTDKNKTGWEATKEYLKGLGEGSSDLLRYKLQAMVKNPFKVGMWGVGIARETKAAARKIVSMKLAMHTPVRHTEFVKQNDGSMAPISQRIFVSCCNTRAFMYEENSISDLLRLSHAYLQSASDQTEREARYMEIFTGIQRGVRHLSKTSTKKFLSHVPRLPVEFIDLTRVAKVPHKILHALSLANTFSLLTTKRALRCKAVTFSLRSLSASAMDGTCSPEQACKTLWSILEAANEQRYSYKDSLPLALRVLFNIHEIIDVHSEALSVIGWFKDRGGELDEIGLMLAAHILAMHCPDVAVKFILSEKKIGTSTKAAWAALISISVVNPRMRIDMEYCLSQYRESNGDDEDLTRDCIKSLLKQKRVDLRLLGTLVDRLPQRDPASLKSFVIYDELTACSLSGRCDRGLFLANYIVSHHRNRFVSSLPMMGVYRHMVLIHCRMGNTRDAKKIVTDLAAVNSPPGAALCAYIRETHNLLNVAEACRLTVEIWDEILAENMKWLSGLRNVEYALIRKSLDFEDCVVGLQSYEKWLQNNGVKLQDRRKGASACYKKDSGTPPSFSDLALSGSWETIRSQFAVYAKQSHTHGWSVFEEPLRTSTDHLKRLRKIRLADRIWDLAMESQIPEGLREALKNR